MGRGEPFPISKVGGQFALGGRQQGAIWGDITRGRWKGRIWEPQLGRSLFWGVGWGGPTPKILGPGEGGVGLVGENPGGEFFL